MTNYNNSKTAKLDKRLFFQIGNGTLPITGNAINFMLYTISFVAKDGRIYCDTRSIKNQLNIQHKTFKRVIGELKLLNLISEKEGFLYSHFHVLSNGENKDKGYIRNIRALSSEDVLSLNIKKKRFFLYVASFSIIGIPKSVSVESLYSNKYHFGVNYVDSYQELSKILFEFVHKGYFVVYINGRKYDKNSRDFENTFHTFCNFDQVNGKKRMSKIKKHKIGIQIHENLTRNIRPNQSSQEDFRYYADQYHVYHEIMRSETIPFFISIQNELFELLGEEGVRLYRHALISYFSTEQENVLYHDLMSDKNETKAVNTMMDFYLIKEIQNTILKVLTNNISNKAIDFFIKNHRFSELVRYFIQKSSDNQKILFDSELEKYGIHFSDLIEMEPNNNNKFNNHWVLLNNHISDIYESVNSELDSQFVNIRETIRKWAENGILAKKEWIQQSVEELKDKISPLISEKRQKVSIGYSASENDNKNKNITDNIYIDSRRRQRNLFQEKIKEMKQSGRLDNMTINC